METNEDKKWCVYIHRNMINNKAYIGITSQNTNERWGVDGKEYCRGTQPRFQNAIQKYGWENFEHIIWADGLTEEEANHLEILLIAMFKTNCCRYKNPSYGYNLTDGGGGMSGHKDTAETKKKKSEASRDMWAQDGFREKMVQIHTGSKHRPFSEQARRNISESLKGRFPREKNPMCRKVYSLELDEEFYSAIDAHDKYGVSAQGISNCCNGKQKTAGRHPITGEPLTWEYVDKTYIEINQSKQGTHKKGVEWWNIRPVNQYSLDGKLIKRWGFIQEAGENCGIDPGSIRKCCAGIYNQAGGFLWRYRDEYDEDYLNFDIPKPKNKGSVIQLDKNNNFIDEGYCVAELARIKNFDSSSLNKCCNGRMKFYRGYQFVRRDMYELFVEQFGKDLSGFTIYDLIHTIQND